MPEPANPRTAENSAELISRATLDAKHDSSSHSPQQERLRINRRCAYVFTAADPFSPGFALYKVSDLGVCPPPLGFSLADAFDP
jgi:hypothetical protein